MKRKYSILLLLITLGTTFQHDKIEKKTKLIVAEGKRLYRSEMASWYGTDIFIQRFDDKEKVGGYFSYPDGDVAKCIFFSKGDSPKVLGTISFDSTYDVKTAKVDLAERGFTSKESELFTIRASALKVISSDTLFKKYRNTSLNPIPIISDGERKVYVLTGPKNDGVVVFGNDYLLTFDKNHNLIRRKQLHKNIIVTEYGQKAEDEKVSIAAMHTHLPETGDFITATDICTLMLYEKFTGWDQYNVVSEKYLSVWNCHSNTLNVISTDVIRKITDHEKQLKKAAPNKQL